MTVYNKNDGITIKIKFTDIFIENPLFFLRLRAEEEKKQTHTILTKFLRHYFVNRLIDSIISILKIKPYKN